MAVDLDPAAGQRVGDVLRRDRAVELAALADLDAHRQGRAADPGRGDLGVGALAHPLVLAARDVVLPRPVGTARGGHGQLLRDEEVRREAVRDLLHLPALAELGHVLRQDDLHALVSSLLIQARVRGPRPSCLMASPTPPMSAGTRRMVRRTGPGVKRRTWATSRSNSARSMPSSGELLVEQVVRHAVEEQLDGEDDDDEVVETADDRDVVGDQVATEDEVARGAGQQRLAVGRHPLVHDERGDEPGVHRDAAGDRQEREQRERAPEPGRVRSNSCFALPCFAPCARCASCPRDAGV